VAFKNHGVDMQRRKEIQILSEEHHHGLMLAQMAKKNAPEFKNLPNDIDGKIKFAEEAWNDELEEHFRKEEEILFPAARGKKKEIDDLMDELLEEHVTIKDLIFSLRDAENKEEKLHELSQAMDKHIRKEERQLFEMIQDTLTDKELTAISEKLN
jgi:iron-sulfur cluster repair protein YtfE (RIC family)